MIELDKTEYKKGDTVNVTAYLKEDMSRNVIISVVNPNGDEVSVTNGSFVMTVAGKYIITASIIAPSHYAGSYSVEVEALVEHIMVGN